MQLAAAGTAGANFTARFVRRLGGLFVLGGLHAVLLFQGDILTTYALLGLVLLAVHRIQPRTAVIAAGAIVSVIAVGMAVAALAGVEMVTDQDAALADGRASTDALAGGLGSVIDEHLRSLPTMAASLAVQGPLALAAFLVGLAAGRRKLLADGIGRRTVVLRRLELVGYPIGLAGALVFAVGGGTASPAALAASILTAPLLVSAYVATLLRVFATPRGGRLARALAPAGRMALSDYLGQSLLGVLIFTGVGLGLTGDTPPTVVPVVAVTPENEADILVHDAHNASPTTAFALSRLADPDTLHHTPIGVFRSVGRPVYDTLMADQLDTAVDQHGKGDLAALLAGGDTWTVAG
ncbi:DUF418 domain-containing protein [Streptomyces werraensis]|uniref:DUF418 domain-containing protein n=1 Tax=Streptomyces werraensis TaxID=68284 RepID=UPI0037D2F990